MTNSNAELTLDRVNEIARNYYKEILFLFLPNVCNAKCNFCYLKPKFSENAQLPARLLDEMRDFLNLTYSLGFREIRVTGGEPLVFRNFDALIEILKASNLEYTLLTNGTLLSRNLKHLTANKPKKVILSFHSIKNYQKIFGSAVDWKNTVLSIKTLLDYEIEVVIAIIFLDENRNEVVSLIEYFHNIGIKKFKIICPNTPSFNDKYKHSFLDLTMSMKEIEYSSKDIEVRFTDLTQSDCLLKERGFLSLTIPSFHLFGCCATIPYGYSHRAKPFELQHLSTILINTYEKFSLTNQKYPCKCYIQACPISLCKL